MTETELEPVRNQLLELERRLRADVGSLASEVAGGAETPSGGDLSNAPVEDRAERGSDSSDDDVTIGLLKLESTLLGEITAALGRIAGGTFGRCAGCARAIPRDRLRAVPFARRCIACARTEHP
jgi:RNA polymerase-binding transcription factor DksA